MTKRERKEKVLLLLGYSFINNYNTECNGCLKKENISVYNLFMKLYRFRTYFANHKIQNFLFKRILKKDDILVEIEVLLFGLMFIYFFKLVNQTKKIVINEDIETMIVSVSEPVEDELVNKTIDTAVKLFLEIYPDKEGLIEFKKQINNFPFNLIKGGKK